MAQIYVPDTIEQDDPFHHRYYIVKEDGWVMTSFGAKRLPIIAQHTSLKEAWRLFELVKVAGAHPSAIVEVGKPIEEAPEARNWSWLYPPVERVATPEPKREMQGKYEDSGSW